MRTHVIPVVALLVLAGCGNADLTCSSSTTLDALTMCIRAQMPASGSNGYVAPTADQRADWQRVVTQMLQGKCDFAVPASLSGMVQVRTFTDTSNSRNYCLLMEVRDQNGNGVVDNGFGTFITYRGAARQVSHQAVHPIADSATENQAVSVFRDTDSRSFLMAGAHRDANSAMSTCRPSFPESDPSHNSSTMTQATNEALLAYYGPTSWFAIQWHGMAAATCPMTDVYPSHGRDVATAPTDKIAILRQNVLAAHGTWDVDLPGLPGSEMCRLNATENVQGRLLNGVTAANVCGTEPSRHTQTFVHIEQDPNFRNPADWVTAIKATFP
jgi:hypothetical protein